MTPHIPPGPLWSGEAASTWLPPLLGFTNTSRGFMRGDGVGLMMKGFQRPSLETERARQTPPVPEDPALALSGALGAPHVPPLGQTFWGAWP